MAESAALLVDEVLPEQPLRQWVLSFPFQLRFLFASRPEIMGRVLGIVYRVIATHLIKKAGHSHQAARTGAVTLIQHFGSVLKLNIHFHMLFLDGVCVARPDGATRFRWVKAPTGQELTQLAHTIAHRIGRFLERQGLLERDAENSYLTGETMDDDPLNQLLGSSITYCIAVGPQQGRKVFTLQTLPACDPEDQFGDTVGKVAGYRTVASRVICGPSCCWTWVKRVFILPMRYAQKQRKLFLRKLNVLRQLLYDYTIRYSTVVMAKTTST